MKTFTTIINAIDPTDGKLKKWRGQDVKAKNWTEAEKWCKENAGYLKIDGELLYELPVKRSFNLN